MIIWHSPSTRHSSCASKILEVVAAVTVKPIYTRIKPDSLGITFSYNSEALDVPKTHKSIVPLALTPGFLGVLLL